VELKAVNVTTGVRIVEEIIKYG